MAVVRDLQLLEYCPRRQPNPYAIAPKASLTAPMANGASTAEAHVKKRMTPAAAPCSDFGRQLMPFELSVGYASGCLLGGSLTAALGAALLATPAAELIGSSVRLFDPVAYTASLLCIVTACTCAALIPALRAGRINPVGALRQD